MNLKRYKEKRDFSHSPEPRGKSNASTQKSLSFVIQKHAASHLHYDFRLEVRGVLKSWAVPKGPSLDPHIKRLAIQVEDHPYDYKDFEGVIPSGYGAGTVMVWDQGTYYVPEAPDNSEALILQGLKKGELHLFLEGEKLQGVFTLVRLKKEHEWLLIKKKDDFVSQEEVLLKDRSVVSHKTLEEIAGKQERIKKSPQKESKNMRSLFPLYLTPMLATLIDAPFNDPEWIFEIKLDGYRALAEIQGEHVELYSRNLLSFNARFPQILQDLKKLKIEAILDGEIVALDEKGVSQFQQLQNNGSDENIYFYVFDLLFLQGEDLRSHPLIERKKILKKLIKSKSHIRYLDHVEKNGVAFFALCEEHSLEGAIGKARQSAYQTGQRSREWVKIKREQRQEVIICGFTEPKKSRKSFGALLMGVYREGVLEFAGHVGGGFTEKELKEIKALLLPLATSQSPFKIPPITNTAVTWVKPHYLCEVKFREWTDEGIMRQPIFLGIRSDKPIQTVVQEMPKSLKEEPLLEKYEFLTHLDKVFWENEKITKGDLISYYDSIAPYILPYLKNRPESLKRSPHGLQKESFFQKNLESHPEWVATVEIEHSEKMVNYLVIQNVESLLYAVNLGCIEIHPWLSNYKNIDQPDFLLLDLDPETISFGAVIETALVIHQLLDEIKVAHYCKTSGSRGLHICIPLKAKYTYEQTKQFAQLLALFVHQQLPQITSLERSPKQRQERVYIDCLQNNFGQTIIAPYSVRAKPGAPVSTPLEWSEVREGLNPLDYTLFNTLERIQQKGDLFKGVLQRGADLSKAVKSLSKMI